MNQVSKVLWTCDSCYKGCMALSLGTPDDELCPLQMRSHWTSLPAPPRDDRDLMDAPYCMEELAEI